MIIYYQYCAHAFLNFLTVGACKLSLFSSGCKSWHFETIFMKMGVGTLTLGKTLQLDRGELLVHLCILWEV
jgi:hypothetical protein